MRSRFGRRRCGVRGAAAAEGLEPRRLLAASPSAGHLDGTFAFGGHVETDVRVRSQDDAKALAVAADGHVVVVGFTHPPAESQVDTAVVRYRPDGSLDPGFGAGGRLALDLGGADSAWAVTVQNDGKILVGGISRPGANTDGLATVTRLRPDGTRDATFATNGVFTADLDGPAHGDTVERLAVAADGKIYALFRGVWQNGLLRLNSDGTRDASFGQGGVVMVQAPLDVDDFAVQPNGKMFFVGWGSKDNRSAWGLARLNADGSNDATFGTNGMALHDFDVIGYHAANRVVVLPAAGAAGTPSYLVGGIVDGSLGVAKFNADGSADASFGTNGLTRHLSQDAHSMVFGGLAVQADGRVLFNGAPPLPMPELSLVYARLTPGGAFDTTFGSGGVIAAPADYTAVVGLALWGPDERIVSGGTVIDPDRNPGVTYNFFAERRHSAVRAAAVPVGHTGGPYAVEEGTTVNLNAALSYDEDGRIVSYEWDTDYDGVTFTADLTGEAAAIPAAQVNGPVARTVALRVTDDDGQSSVATTPLAVAAVPPTVRVSGERRTIEGSPYTLNLLYRDGADVPTSWTIDWGDGVVETVPGNPPTATHVYRDGPATHAITAAANDADGTWAAPEAAVDVRFGGNGVIGENENLGEFGRPHAVLVQPDGKVVTAGIQFGTSWTSRFYRWLPDGTMDFGFAPVEFAGVTRVHAMALQPDGKIVAAGTRGSDSRSGDFVVIRLRADGFPDTGFAQGGVRQINFGGNDHAYALALPSDGTGSILVGGSSGTDKVALAKLDRFGQLDPTFGVGGTVVATVAPFSPAIDSLAVEPSGKILASVSGEAEALLRGNIFGPARLLRFNPNGLPDRDFDGDGSLTLTNPGLLARGGSTRVAAMPDGKILVAFTSEILRLLRFNNDATPDDSFGTSGVSGFTFGGTEVHVAGLVVRPDGKFIVGGSTDNGFYTITDRRIPASDGSVGNSHLIELDPGNSFDRAIAMSVADNGTGDIALGGIRRDGSNFRPVIAKFSVFKSVTVADARHTVSVGGPQTGFAGAPVTFSLSHTDPGEDPVQSWQVDWGDGSGTTLPGGATSADHPYAIAGTYRVSVTATDDDGTYATSRTIYILPVPAIAEDGSLVVRGSPVNDRIELRPAAGGTAVAVTVNGHTWQFDAARVARVDVMTLAGLDTVIWDGVAAPGVIDLGEDSDQAVVSAPDGTELLTVRGGVGNGAGFQDDKLTLLPGTTRVVRFEGGVGADTLVLPGTPGNDEFVLTATAVTVNGRAPATFTDLELVEFAGGDGDDRATANVPVVVNSNTRGLGIRLDGGAGNDVLDVTSAWSASMIGGPGDDAAFIPEEIPGEPRLNTVQGSTIIDGGDGDDSLTWTASDTPTHRFGTTAPTVHDFVGLTRDYFFSDWGQYYYPNIESLTLRGGLGNDQFVPMRPRAGLRLTFVGGDGNDQMVLGDDGGGVAPLPTPLAGDASFDGGAGTDLLVLRDHTTGGFTYALGAGGVSIGGREPVGGQLTYAGLETVTLWASNGLLPDTFRVTPAEATRFFVHGGNPAGPAGDALQIIPAGAAGTTLTPGAAGAGQYTFTNRQPVAFTGIEQVADAIPPRVLSATYAAGAVAVTFDEPVTGTFASGQLSLRNAATGAIHHPTGATYDAPTRTASYAVDLPPGLYTADFNGAGITDAAGNAIANPFSSGLTVQGVVARQVFYNRSAFDGHDPAATVADDAAIATDKRALLPGQAAGFANVTSYSRGINGLMIDVAGLPANSALGPDDFSFRFGSGPDPSAFSAGTSPVQVSVRRGAGAGGSDRITLTWADGAIKNTWLRVTVHAGNDSGLASPDVFYFGNLVGESGDPATPRRVSGFDLTAVRRLMGRGQGITGKVDFDRDGRVTSADWALARANQPLGLELVTAPVAPSPAPAAGWKPAAASATQVLRDAPAKRSILNDPHAL